MAPDYGDFYHSYYNILIKKKKITQNVYLYATDSQHFEI